MPEQMKKVVFWRSLQTKYALTYISIIAAVIVLLNTYPVLLPQDLVYQSKHAALKKQAAALLPPYMIPRRLMAVESFPLNVSGKIDKKALAARLEGTP